MQQVPGMALASVGHLSRPAVDPGQGSRDGTLRQPLTDASSAPECGTMAVWNFGRACLSTTPFVAAFAGAHGIRRLALYGSALRDDFGPGSDIDLLVEFRPGHTPGLLHLAQMELELEEALGRSVELRTPEDLSPYFRDEVTATAQPLYAA